MHKILHKLAQLTIIFLLASNYPAMGQKKDTTDSPYQAGWGTLNYAVPESPAFKILGVSPSNILRPATTRDIAISVGNYVATSGATIPTNLSVAISPSIFNPKIPLDTYKKNKYWYNSSLSIGTKQNANKSYALAFGLSFKVIDNADLRSNDAFINFINTQGPLINASFTDAAKEEAFKMASSWQMTPHDALVEVYKSYNDTTDPNHKSVLQDITNSMTTKSVNGAKLISNYRDSIKNVLWNATILEIGVAGLLNAKDSLIKDISTPPQYGLWATYGHSLTSKGQILIGLNAQSTIDSLTNKSVANFNAGFRLYFGKSDFKGFIQGEGKYMDHELPAYDAAVGIETTFFGGLWLDFGLGIKKSGNAAVSFNPTINFFFANGEKK